MSKMTVEITKRRLEQSKEFLEDAIILFNQGRFRSSNNRAYYSILYSEKAILSLEPKDFKKHKTILAYFNENYINKNIFPKSLGHNISIASKVRDNSDYNEFYIISKAQTEDQINTAKSLFECSIKYIENWCKENKYNIDLTYLSKN